MTTLTRGSNAELPSDGAIETPVKATHCFSRRHSSDPCRLYPQDTVRKGHGPNGTIFDEGSLRKTRSFLAKISPPPAEECGSSTIDRGQLGARLANQK